MKLLYDVLSLAALSLVLPYQYFKRPRGVRGRWLKERSGFYGKFWRKEEIKGPVLWIHAVSVGETLAAVPLVKALYREVSQNIVLTTVTDTGRALAQERLAGMARVFYIPFDTPFAINRVLKGLEPDLLAIVETELWPGLIDRMSKRNRPVVLLNGRISEKSFLGYRKVRFFMKPLLEQIALFCMQEEVYAKRIIDMGAPVERVKVLGNFKYDITPSLPVPKWTQRLSRPLLVAGSTHEGEEEIILSVYKRLKEHYPGLGLVLAPRHPERFTEVEGLIAGELGSCHRRSELETGGLIDTAVVLLDTIGELSSVYGASDISLMGGSFVAKGGHNILEPAYWKKPVLFGPYMENFPMAEAFVKAGAAVASSAESLYRDVKRLLDDKEAREGMGRRARMLYEQEAGSVSRAVKEIQNLLHMARFL